jgi:DNA modification methylase
LSSIFILTFFHCNNGEGASIVAPWPSLREATMTKGKLKIVEREPGSLTPYERNARAHSKKQVRQIANSIARFGFNVPVLVDGRNRIIAGHGRVDAAKLLKLEQVPTILVDHLSDEERRAFIIADNKIALNASWDSELLGSELLDLSTLDIDVTLTGFSLAEIDLVIGQAEEGSTNTGYECGEDTIPQVDRSAITRRGDLFQLDRHCLLCGDARKPSDYTAVTFDEPVDLIFTDPPYNCPINGHVSGLGKVKHREFAMASGEMSDGEFVEFLSMTLGAASGVCRDGAIAFVCMDWRGMGAILTAGSHAFSELKQLCVWNKTNGGMGTFYRSKHELVFVFKKGTAPHTNTFGLGDTGRYRTNVWDYPGINSISATRSDELALHPTPKPVAMIADALRDCTRRGEVVLDPFAGSGSTLIAAQMTGRAARLIEYDPLYCDVIIRRFEQFTGRSAVLMTTGQSFEELAAERSAQIEEKAA